MRALEGKRIPYQVLTYPDIMRDAEEIAAYLGLSPGEVFKTLVVLPPESGKKPALVMVPADHQLDLKKAASAMKTKKVKMATQREAEELTGLQVGGISALALLNRGFAVWIDESAAGQPSICVSAGRRGIQLRVATSDLVKLTSARQADLASVAAEGAKRGQPSHIEQEDPRS